MSARTDADAVFLGFSAVLAVLWALVVAARFDAWALKGRGYLIMRPYALTRGDARPRHIYNNKTPARMGARAELSSELTVLESYCAGCSCDGCCCGFDTDGDWWWLDCRTHCDACLLECISGIVAPEPLATLADAMRAA